MIFFRTKEKKVAKKVRECGCVIKFTCCPKCCDNFHKLIHDECTKIYRTTGKKFTYFTPVQKQDKE